MIQEFKFGFFKIDGKPYYDDLKIVQGKIKPWEDRDKHDLHLNDLKELIAAQPELLIIGIGASGLLQVSNEIKQELRAQNIHLVVKKTGEACDDYNTALEEQKNVAALFHATC